MALAGAMLLLTGCVGGLRTTKMPVDIGFHPVIGHDTRAVSESIPFPQDESFKLYAADCSNGSLYITDEEISFRNDGWRASRKWPEASLHFEAYWPTDLNPEYSRSEGLQIKDFNALKDGRSILLATAESDNEIDTLVTLRFDYILSRVEFRMLHSLSEDMAVRLKKVEIKDFALTGDYNTKISRGWYTENNTDSYVVYEAAEGEAMDIPAGKPIYVGNEFFGIPQTHVPQLVVDYEVRFGTATWVPQTETIECFSTDWEQSKHYTYTLNLQMNELTYTTGISSWDNRE